MVADVAMEVAVASVSTGSVAVRSGVTVLVRLGEIVGLGVVVAVATVVSVGVAVGIDVMVGVDVWVGVGVLVRVGVLVGLLPKVTQSSLPLSRKVWPAIGINSQS